MSDEILGIETLKQTALTAIKFGQKLEDALADGKLSWGEGLSLAIGVAPDVFKLVPKASLIIAEYKDLSDEERKELAEFIVTELDLESDKVEVLVEKGFALLVALDELIEAAKGAKE